MDRKRIFIWGGLLLVTVIALLLLGYFLRTELQITGGRIGVPLDDAWIHFQFARNISHGQGFSYNPGDPTPGSTAPLWTILLSVAGLLGIDYLGAGLALSAIFYLMSVWLTYGFTYWITRTVWPALLAGLGLALTGRMLWAGLAGMETTAFAALSLAAIWVYSCQGMTWFPALLFGLAGQFRPEGHALFALAILDSLWVWWGGNRRISSGWLHSLIRQFAIPLTLYALAAAPYGLFSLATTGRPLPNTFYAKAGSQYFFSWRTLQETIDWHWRDNPMSLILGLFGLLPLWRRSRLSVMWLLGLPVFTALIIDFTWHHGRYTMPLIPLQMVAAATGVYWLSRFLTQQSSKAWLSWLGEVLPIAVTILLLLEGVWRLKYWANMLGHNAREIQEIDVALGEWLLENSDADDLLAVDDIGAIAFISGRRIVDMNGLVSPEVWPATRAPEGLPRSQVMTRILSEMNPDLMVAFPLWRWEIVSNPAVSKPVHHVQTDTHTIIFQPDAYVYKTTWPYLSEVDPENRLTSKFGEEISLLGYDLHVGDILELVLYWESITSVTDSYDIFVHLVDESGEIVAQADRKPLDGLAATDIWHPGDIVRDPLTIPLPHDLSGGSYELWLGVYLRESGERLALQDGESTENALILETILIP